MLKARINLIVSGGAAKPNPKMGQALGPLGINMMQFCKDINEKTSEFRADVPVRIQLRAFNDRTYTYKVKPPQTSWFLKKVTGIATMSKRPGWIEVGTVPIQYIYEIARIKQLYDEDLAKTHLEEICKMVIAQANGMGLVITLDNNEKVEPIFIDF